MHGNNDGTFAAPNAQPSSGAIAEGFDTLPGGFSIQDVDGDGNLDVLFSTYQRPTAFGVTVSQSSVYLAYGNGEGTFQPAVAAISTLGYPQSINFADAKATASSTRSHIMTATSLSIPGPVQANFPSGQHRRSAAAFRATRTPSPRTSLKRPALKYFCRR
jgi:hypothetical protein